MIQSFINLAQLWENDILKINNSQLDQNIKPFTFFNLLEKSNLDKISGKIKDTKIIIINQYQFEDETTKSQIFIVVLKKSIIIIENSLKPFLDQLHSLNRDDMSIYFLPSFTDIPDHNLQNVFQVKNDPSFWREIWNFNEYLKLKGQNASSFDTIWIIFNLKINQLKE